MLVRQLEEELRLRMRAPNIEMQQQMEALYAENEHLQREISILRDTIKVGKLLNKLNKNPSRLKLVVLVMRISDKWESDYLYSPIKP